MKEEVKDGEEEKAQTSPVAVEEQAEKEVKEDEEMKPEVPPVVTQAPIKPSYKHLFDLIDAIKTLQKPDLIDPLAKHSFDTSVVETMQKQRTMILQKKSSIASSKLDEHTPKLSFGSSKEDGQRMNVKAQMKSSIRKAREDKDKSDSIEHTKPSGSNHQGQSEQKSPTKSSGKHKSTTQKDSAHSGKNKSAKSRDEHRDDDSK